MKNLRIMKDVLFIDNNKLSFDNVIGGILMTDDFIIVHLFKEEINRINMYEQTGNNIYAVDYKGNIIWNIKEIVGQDECWVKAMLNEKNQLIAKAFSGIEYKIDPKLKKIIDYKKGAK